MSENSKNRILELEKDIVMYRQAFMALRTLSRNEKRFDPAYWGAVDEICDEVLNKFFIKTIQEVLE